MNAQSFLGKIYSRLCHHFLKSWEHLIYSAHTQLSCLGKFAVASNSLSSEKDQARAEMQGHCHICNVLLSFGLCKQICSSPIGAIVTLCLGFEQDSAGVQTWCRSHFIKWAFISHFTYMVPNVVPSLYYHNPPLPLSMVPIPLQSSKRSSFPQLVTERLPWRRCRPSPSTHPRYSIWYRLLLRESTIAWLPAGLLHLS